MSVRLSDEDPSVIASARDIGNVVAGYVAAANGLTYDQARDGFDSYQSIHKGGGDREGISTTSAQQIGHNLGSKSTTPQMSDKRFRDSIGQVVFFSLIEFIKVMNR